jgi:hypothetical protein
MAVRLAGPGLAVTFGTTGYSLKPVSFWLLALEFYLKTAFCLHRLDKELGLDKSSRFKQPTLCSPSGTFEMHLRFSFPCALVLAAIVSIPARAQDPLDDVYGHAVHAYFRGDAATAQQWLNDAIASGSQDPRAFYFRGLCEAAMSNDPEAGVSDFEQAAQMEIDGKRVVNVGKALERIQGPVRCHIEAIRRKARLASRGKYLEMQRLRYEQGIRNGAAVPASPSDAPPRPVPSINDPFSEGADLNKGQPKPMLEQVKPAPVSNDPFGDAPAPANPAPASDDPFGGNSAKPNAPPASDDPFGN